MRTGNENPPRTRWQRTRTWIVPVALLLAVTLPHLDQGDWQRTDSGRYAAIGLQAWRTGTLWTPQSEPGVPYCAKPPMVLWLHGLSLHLLGVGPVQARLPTVLAALGSVALVVFITRRLVGDQSAVVAGAVLALTYEFFRRTREISLDMWQMLFMLAGVAIFVRLASGPPPRARWSIALAFAAGACFGLALLCKPLVALAAPLLIGAWLAWTGRARLLAHVGVAVAAALAVAAPWHVAMWWTHGDTFTAQYFGREIAARAAGGLPDSEGGRVAPWFYVAALARTYWPWLPFALAGAVRGRPATAAWRLALLWFGAWLLLLTLFPDRRDRYALPLYPALAILAGLAFAEPLSIRSRRLLEHAINKAIPVAAGLGVLVALLPIQVQRPPEPQWERLFEWIDSRPGPGAELWQGAFGLERGARVYLRYGYWPRTTRDGMGRFLVDRESQPPPGALLLYHARDGLRPGPNESEVFSTGDLAVFRLDSPGWRPVPPAPDNDPG